MIGWLLPWEPSVIVPLALILSGAFYACGCDLRPQSFVHSLSYWSGWILLYMASFTQFDYYAEHSFFVHRLQHGIMHHIAPFLIAFSRPGAAFEAAAPQQLRSLWGQLLHRPLLRKLIDIVNNPVIATILFVGLTALWLIPRVHFIAMLDWRYYRLMNWTMVINGLMFWNLVLNNTALRPAFLTPATRIVMMLAAVPPQIVMGALIFLAPNELYSVYSICGRAFSGMTALADQQIGGFIIWGPTAMMSVPGIIVVARREWMGQQAGEMSSRELSQKIS